MRKCIAKRLPIRARPSVMPRRAAAVSLVAYGAAYPGDAALPGGKYLLGARRGDDFVFDNEKWEHAVTLQPFALARAAVTNREFAGSSTTTVTHGASCGATRAPALAHRRRCARAAVLAEAARWLVSACLCRRCRARAAGGSDARQLVRGGCVVPVGRPPAAVRSGMGTGRCHRDRPIRAARKASADIRGAIRPSTCAR